jgi:ribosomal protein L7/L12
LIQIAIFAAVYGVIVHVHPHGGYVYFVLVILVASIIGASVTNAVLPVRVVDHVPGEHDLTLVSPGPRPLDVVKELRARCGMSFREACRRVDSTPTTFRVGDSPDDARRIAARLRAVGAVAELPEPTQGNAA